MTPPSSMVLSVRFAAEKPHMEASGMCSTAAVLYEEGIMLKGEKSTWIRRLAYSWTFIRHFFGFTKV